MLHDPTILGFLIIVNLIALTMALLAWKRPNWGRFLLGGMFLLAGTFNMVYAFRDPAEYVYYADFAFLDSYRNFITGTFAEHLEVFLPIIAVLQLITGIAFWSKGWLLKTGAWMGIAFLVAIAPLGFGAAFPSTLIMALGAWLIYNKGAEASLFKTWLAG